MINPIEYLNDRYPILLEMLLYDCTADRNILWATDSYELQGEDYGFDCEMRIDTVIANGASVVVPRVMKRMEEQKLRSKTKAEVFTPSWVCNAQNNLVDDAWFGREGVFNTEYVDEQGCHRWATNPAKIQFAKDKTWKDYIRDTRLEMTCGEAPYLISRYDTTTGKSIALKDRIGIFDRKMRVVSERACTVGEFRDWALMALKHTYGFEWQGDSLLLARVGLLLSYIEYYEAFYKCAPPTKALVYTACVIVWNVWQMDGLKGVIPCTCHDEVEETTGLFGEVEKRIKPCKGCKGADIHAHNGTYCYVMDWDSGKKMMFIDLINRE